MALNNRCAVQQGVWACVQPWLEDVIAAQPPGPAASSPEREAWETIHNFVRMGGLYDEEQLFGQLLKEIEQAQESLWLWRPRMAPVPSATSGRPSREAST
jgi:hypothetical protein